MHVDTAIFHGIDETLGDEETEGDGDDEIVVFVRGPLFYVVDRMGWNFEFLRGGIDFGW